MDFAWTAQTLVAFGVGLAVGLGCGYFAAKRERDRNGAATRPGGFCRHCGKPVDR